MTETVDFLYGVQHCGVVLTPKSATDLCQGGACEFFCQVHRYLAGYGDRPGIALGLEQANRLLKIVRNRFLNGLYRSALLVVKAEVVSGQPEV